MVTAINFAVRNSAGGRQHGTVAGEGQGNFIQVGSGDSISLNIAPSSVVAYEQQGRDLIIKLADGRMIVLAGYFDAAEGVNSLYLSSNDQITEVVLTGDGNGVLMANYGPVQPMEKWSPLDDLRFAEADGVIDGSQITDEPAGMGLFAPAMLGGLGGVGALGAGLVGIGLIGGGGGGGGDTDTTPGGGGTDTTPGGGGTDTTPGGGGTDTTPGGGGTDDDRVPPTVNDPDNQETLTTNTTNPTIDITGTGEPGDTVVVTIGDQTQTTVIGSDSTWAVDFESDELPADGSYSSVVVVTEPGGTEHVLDGPDYIIDMTPPVVEVTEGTESAGDIENLADYANGITIAGEGEVGASIVIEVGGLTRDTVVDANGNWSFTFTQDEIAGGERTLDVTVTATDPLGNVTVVTDRLVIDTVPHPVSIDPVTENNLVNEAEHSAGFTMTGSTSPNTQVTLVLEANGTTVTRTFTSDASGNWSQEFLAGEVPAGTYQATATLTTVDGAGNPSSVTRTFEMDTEISVEIDATQVDDNRISGEERDAGFTLTGTGEPGAVLTVSVTTPAGTVTHPATVGANGQWSIAYDPAELPAGTYAATVSVSARDAAGNIATDTQTIQVDTETSVTIGTQQTSDNIISGSERLAGITLTGTAEVGATLTVTFNGVTYNNIQPDSSGNWSVPVSAANIPTGTTTATVTVVAEDSFGNTDSATHVVAIDTEVVPLLPGQDLLAGDGYLNAAEAADGLVVTGASEPNSTITVRIMVGNQTVGTPIVIETDASGNWSANFGSSNLPRGELDARVVVSARDLAGNVDGYSQPLIIDTIAPGAPNVVTFARVSAGLTRIVTAETDENYEFTRIDSNGNTTRINAVRSIDEVTGDENITFGSRGAGGFTPTPVPDGSYLVVDSTDVAGNQSSTLMVINNTNAPDVDLSRPGLTNFDFSAIDLSFAPDADLTITEAQILSITGADKTIVVKGGDDDRVEIINGLNTGETREIDGETYNIYTVGASGATILLDDDIQTA